MMQKTVKKNKKEGSGKRLSYIVTENGLVENNEVDDDAQTTRRGSRRESNSRSLINSLTEVADAKLKFKALANRKKLGSEAKVPEEDKKDKSQIMKDPKAALAELNAAEANKRRASLKTPSSRRDSVEDLRLNNKDNSEDEIGLLESDAMKKAIQQVGSAFLISKAIASMNGPRRNRQAMLKSVRPLQ